MCHSFFHLFISRQTGGDEDFAVPGNFFRQLKGMTAFSASASADNISNFFHRFLSEIGVRG